jgi:cytochrome b
MSAPRKAEFAVWDLPTRLFHWLLVVLVAMTWLSAQFDWFEIHFLGGYAVLSLLLFRLAWGMVGGGAARFAAFVRGPRAAIAHVRHLRLPPEARPFVPGHNPLGGWMVLLLLAVLGLQTATGLFSSDEIVNDGPLSGHLTAAGVKIATGIHKVNANLILGAAAIHVLAVLTYWIIGRENLIRAMITGRKPLPPGAAPAPLRRTAPALALVLFLIAIALVAALVTYGG